MKTIGWWWAAILMLPWLFMACDDKRVHDSYLTLPSATWDSDSIQSYKFIIVNTRINHNIYVNVRNDRTFPYSNLWLFVTVEQPGGKQISDTLQVILADHAGKWLGRGFTGVFDNRFVYRNNVFFPDIGTYTIRLQHGMRDKSLKGITDIGVRVEKIK